MRTDVAALRRPWYSCIGVFEGSFQSRRRELPWVGTAHSDFHAMAASMQRVLILVVMYKHVDTLCFHWASYGSAGYLLPCMNSLCIP